MGETILIIMYLKVFLFIIWCIISMAMLTAVTTCLTMASTLFNILGTLLAVGYILLSLKTKCFTQLKFKKSK